MSTETKQKFRPGMKVKVTGNQDTDIPFYDDPYHTFPIGHTVTIMRENSFLTCWKCIDDEGNIQLVNESDLSPLQPLNQ